MRMQPMPVAGGRLGEARGILPLIAAAYGAARAATGIIQGNQNRQRNKGIISQAYRTGRERLDLSQQDQRQNIAESAVARGLTGGGGVRIGGPVHPVGGSGVGALNHGAADVGATPVSVTGAYDLGSQQGEDLAREQQLSQTELVRQKDAALSSNNADYMNTIVGSVGSGIDSAASLATAGGPATPSVAGAFGAGGMPQGTPAPDMPKAPGAALTSPYANAFGGIDPVSPLTRGAWAQGTNADFNAYT